jgi:hypothetical protein
MFVMFVLVMYVYGRLGHVMACYIRLGQVSTF